MEASTRIARNTTYLTIASTLQKIVSFGYFAYISKAIEEVEEGSVGRYAFALAFTSIFVIFMDFGLSSLLTREVAKDESQLQSYFKKIWSTKVFLILISFLACIGVITFAEPLFEKWTPADVQLVYVGAFVIIFDTLTVTFFSIFRSLKQLQWESISIVIYQLSILGTGIYVIQNDLPLPYVIGALLTGSVVQFVFMFCVLKLKTGLKFQFEWNRQQFFQVIAMAAPFAIAGVIFRLSGTIDSIMLKTAIGDVETGFYAIPFKLTFALTVLPGAFATSFFPAMSYYYQHAKEKLHETFEQGFLYMLLLSFPVMGGVFILGDDIILSIWGPFWIPSVNVLWVMMLAVPFIFLNYPVGSFLNAVKKQTLNTVNMGISLVVNVVLNWLLIPYYTFMGAAYALLVSSVVLVLLGVPHVYRIAPFRSGYLFNKASRVAISAGLMSFVLYFIQHRYPVLVLIPMGGVLYVGALLLTGALTKAELQQVIGAVLRRR